MRSRYANIGARIAVHLPETGPALRKNRSNLKWMPRLTIAGAALAVEIPFFFLGTPSGHDVEFHLYSWLEILSQWKQGVIYPRWASLAHFGFGEPRFVFYPPASWTLGAMLTAIFPWTLVPSLYIWIALMAAGVSMFWLARQWFDRRDATFAAVLYAVNPYHLVIVYWRSAFAELLASALLPLLLLLMVRADPPRRWIALVACVLAASWLVNAPAAVMLHYSLALLLLLTAWDRKSPRILVAGGLAVALGAALAAFYLLPAVYEQRWVDIAQSISEGSRPADNFLFVHTADADHDAFNRVVSCVAVAEIVGMLLAAWAARQKKGGEPRLWVLLAVWGTACALFMTPLTLPLWQILPKLSFMQFPWRWLLCMGIPLTLLLTIGVRTWTARVAIYLAMLCVLGFAWHRYQPPWWETSADLNDIKDNFNIGAGYEGTDEYTPLGATPSAVDKNARRVSVEGASRAAIQVSEWSAERKTFTARMSAKDRLVLHLFRYPPWSVKVNGQTVETAVQADTGQMLVPVGEGENRVQVKLARSWDREAGAGISVAAIILILILMRNLHGVWRTQPTLNRYLM